MAVARMSPGHPDAVGAVAKGRQGEFGTHPPGAGDADDADVGRVLHAADTLVTAITWKVITTQEENSLS